MPLQSHETRDLLNTVDYLRSHGINRYINLPEIVVCGERPPGKSSVLQTGSGVEFPSKDNLCIRFATELILQQGTIKIDMASGSRERNRLERDLEKLRNQLPIQLSCNPKAQRSARSRPQSDAYV
jgi:hypothetical protein